MRNGVIVWSVLALLFSCLDEPDCTFNSDTALVIEFKKLLTGEKDTTVFYRVEAEGSDSIFYSQTPADELDTLINTPMILAINPFSETTSFTFFFPVLERKLTIGYLRKGKFISEDCGGEIVFNELTILETQFDSVRIVNPVLTKQRTTNIEIYR
jgi:hypothetical protein